MTTTPILRALAGALLLELAGSATFAAGTFTEAVAGGRVSLNTRLRYEHVDQTALRDADALTVRPRLGFTTAELGGFTGMLEFENTTALDGDAYNQVGLNPGGAGRAVVADPTDTEVNQIWIAYKGHGLTARAGRQRLNYDNARFVGDVGWRQNMQTFDAVSLVAHSTPALTVNYAYLWQVNRVFSARSPVGRWDSDSHLLNAAYKAAANTTVTGYAYLLDFDDARANSGATYGLSVVGAHVFDKDAGSKLSYRAEYARQTDFGDQPLDYSADYLLGELGYARGRFGGGIGWERLGSDGGLKGFATPLATLHAFNGWADLFLTTPANGLDNLYLFLTGTLPGGVAARLVYHDFDTARGGFALGSEWDAQFSKAITKNWSALVKFADFQGRGPAPDVRKFWAQVEFNH